MSVYVDDMKAAVGRLRLCHMYADTPDELRAMIARIGVDPKWIENPGTPREHIDIAQSKRRLAVAAGAVEITQRQMAVFRRAKVQAAAAIAPRSPAVPVAEQPPAGRAFGGRPEAPYQ